MKTNIHVLTPDPLPATTEDLIAAFKLKAGLNLNDVVQDAIEQLYDKGLQPFLAATHDSQAVEGSLSADNVMAAEMLRTWARKNGKTLLANEKLGVIVLAMGVVCRRFGIDRKTRRNTVAGSVVHTNGRSNDE